MPEAQGRPRYYRRVLSWNRELCLDLCAKIVVDTGLCLGNRKCGL